MMASLAHQIRTPLSSALLYSGQLASAKLSQEKIQQFQLHMQQSLKQLERHVSDMLLFASGGVAKSESFTVKELMVSLKQDVVGNLYVDKDIEMNCYVSGIDNKSLYGNQQALCGAISNLIDNSLHACRENKSNGKLTAVSLDIEATEPAELRIIVTDNGCGIDKQHIETVFEAFYTGKARGTGLGLAVVKTVVNNFKGHVEVASDPGKGSQFVIRLPLIEQKVTKLDEPQFADQVGGQ
jgi:two-component system sensor histidine kinase FlrB